MTLFVLQTIGSIVGVAFLIQMFLPSRRQEWLDAVNVSVMSGLIAIGLIAYLILPGPNTVIQVLTFYSPHAYNFILWPSLALLVLRKRFSPKYLVPMFVFVYALDELLWNGLAVAYFWGQWDVLHYLFLPSWHLFILALVGGGAVCYLIARPVFQLNITWLMLGGFAFVWAWFAGFPVLAATNLLSLPLDAVLYRLVWELMWQFVFWGFVYGSVSARASSPQLFMQPPGAG